MIHRLIITVINDLTQQFSDTLIFIFLDMCQYISIIFKLGVLAFSSTSISLFDFHYNTSFYLRMCISPVCMMYTHSTIFVDASGIYPSHRSRLDLLFFYIPCIQIFCLHLTFHCTNHIHYTFLMYSVR